jgi:hypothetical protein
MPGLNQTGPMGQGRMTGRRMGKCSNFGANVNNSTNQTDNANESTFVRGMGRGWATGKGMGAGRGMGMGRQHRFRNGQ